MKRDTLIFGGVFLLLGLAFCGVSAHFLLEQRSFERRAVRADGVVVRLDESQDSSGFSPVVQFKTVDGEVRTVTGTVYSSPPSFEVNEPVAVLYVPSSRDEVLIDSFEQRWLLPLVFGVLGVVFAAIGGGVLGAALRRRLRGVETLRLAPADAPLPGPVEAKNVEPIVAGVFGPISLLMIVAAGLMTSSNLAFEREGERATGKVVDQRRSQRGARPVVEFTTRDGTQARIVGQTLSRPPAYDVGDEVPVLYLAARPQQGRIATFSELWLFPAILVAVGVVFFGLSVLLFVLWRRSLTSARGRAAPASIHRA